MKGWRKERFNLSIYCPRGMGFGEKCFMWRCLKFLYRFLVNGHIPRMSCKSRLLSNDKDDNELKPKAVNGFPVFYLTAEENLT